jgi:glyoxylase-like metal-dependent hydrolase (beta-lactamase superfamily II)
MQILPGVYLINGAPYGRHHNGYLVNKGNATIIIDSGDLSPLGVGNGTALAPSCLPELDHNAGRWGFRLEDATHLFVTHAHFDHASHAAALQRRGLKIVASPEAAEAMAAGDERCIGYAHHRVFEACQADVVLRDGEELDVGELTVRCIAAPGHSEDSVIYDIELEGDRCWFVGDVLATTDTYSGLQVQPPWPGSPGFDRQTYLETASKLLSFRCDHLMPGHGPAGIGCGYALLERLLNVRRSDWQ